MKIYTRTGDNGHTALFGGGRVPKSDARVEAYGEVDELNAVLGVASAAAPADFERPLIESIQRDLFAIGGQLASPSPDQVRKALEKAHLHQHRVTELEGHIDRLNEPLEPLRAFVLPGGPMKAAALHHARTIARRAERRVVALAGESDVPPIILMYLNRLSDLLFAMARRARHDAGEADLTW